MLQCQVVNTTGADWSTQNEYKIFLGLNFLQVGFHISMFLIDWVDFTGCCKLQAQYHIHGGNF